MGRIVANQEFSGRASNILSRKFVLICAWDVPISPILPILPVEESITYLFSICHFVVPFQNINLFRGSLAGDGLLFHFNGRGACPLGSGLLFPQCFERAVNKPAEIPAVEELVGRFAGGVVAAG